MPSASESKRDDPPDPTHGPGVARLADVSYSITEGNNTRTLFESVNVEFVAGALSAILGPSGSGKSSLLSLLGGLATPTAGAVTVNGVDLSLLDEAARCTFRREQIGFVFQDIRLLPQLNAIDNVIYPAWFRFRDPRAARAAANDALEAVGMSHKAASRPAAMSGGERQRVALARVLACNPPLILADEPTAALDWGSAELFLNILRKRVTATRMAAVLVTHDPRVIEWIDHLYHLENGTLRHEPR